MQRHSRRNVNQIVFGLGSGEEEYNFGRKKEGVSVEGGGDDHRDKEFPIFNHRIKCRCFHCVRNWRTWSCWKWPLPLEPNRSLKLQTINYISIIQFPL